MSCQNSGKEEKFYEHNPIHMQFFYCSLLLTVMPKQSQSIQFPGIASCLYLSSGGKIIVFEIYLLQWNVGLSLHYDSCLGNR